MVIPFSDKSKVNYVLYIFKYISGVGCSIPMDIITNLLFLVQDSCMHECECVLARFLRLLAR
jgi:hypothetical protein